MNVKRIKALLMTLVMICSVVMMCACGNKSGETQPTSGGPTGNAVYTVKLKDLLGNPYTDDFVVIFLQNGVEIAMQPVNDEGIVSKELPRGDYDVEIQITKDADKYYYDKSQLKLTAEKTELDVIMSYYLNGDATVLNVSSGERVVYQLTFTPSAADGSEGTFLLEDVHGDLSGTYQYVANAAGGFDVKNEAGEPVDMSISVNLDGSYAFQAGYMLFARSLVKAEGEATEILEGTYTVASGEYLAPEISLGCSYMELNANERNYLLFVPVQAGIYEFTIHNGTGTLGYYGGPNFVMADDAGGTPTGDNSMTVEIKETMIGTSGAGTVRLVIGIDPGEGTENCIVSLVRIGDSILSPEEQPWDYYASTYIPTKYTLPEGLTIKEFDLTASTNTYELVYNETDKFYHLGTADGPIVLVRMDAALPYGASFGAILSTSNIGAYFYDEDGTFLRKELYNACLTQYLGQLEQGMGTYSYTGGMLDDTYGVYPLTEDLKFVIQSYGEYMGLWDSEDVDYLFGRLTNLNPELAWLYMCCYAE